MRGSILRWTVLAGLALCAATACGDSHSLEGSLLSALRTIGLRGEPERPPADFSDPAALTAARALLDRVDPEWQALAERPKIEIAKRMNYLAFNYCEAKRPHTELGPALFEECRYSCSGFVYVLRGLLAVYGIESRHTGLYNIPIQGNHSLVEARVGTDAWILLDPTFGVFFTEDGVPSQKPVDMDTLQFGLAEGELVEHAVSAARESVEDLRRPLEAIYRSQHFDRPLMEISAYRSAEAYGYDDPDLPLDLGLTLQLARGEATFGAQSPIDMDRAPGQFLKVTNRTLNDTAPGNDVSFRISFLGRVNRDARLLLELHALEPSALYRVTLRGVNPGEEFALVASVVDGSGVLRERAPTVIEPGPFEAGFELHSTSRELTLLLERHGGSPGRFVRVFRFDARELP